MWGEEYESGPICEWCSGASTSGLLSAFDQELTREVESTELLDCDNNDLFRFASDLGELGASHVSLQVVRDVIGGILVNIKGQNRVDYYTLRTKTEPTRLVQILWYLNELGYIEVKTKQIPDGLAIDYIVIPRNGLIDKAFVAMEASDQWKEHREPNFVLACVLIHGLAQTIALVENTGTITFGQGLTRIYVSNGHIYIPKQFTAPLMFVIGSWANGHSEFTEVEINQFMTARGLGHKERDRVNRVIGGMNPGVQHTIYRMETYSPGTGSRSLRFVLNPRFVALRDRLRDRMR